MDNTTNATGSHAPGAGGAWANTEGAQANAEGQKYKCTNCGAFLSPQEALPAYKAAKRTFSEMNGTYTRFRGNNCCWQGEEIFTSHFYLRPGQ